VWTPDADQGELRAGVRPVYRHATGGYLLGEALTEVEDVADRHRVALPQAVAVALEAAAITPGARDVDVEDLRRLCGAVRDLPGLALRA
jgi:hypothetical protein